MPQYLVISGEENWAYSIELERGRDYRAGRASDNDIVIKDRRVSSYHARLSSDGDGFELADLESRNGTELNGKRVRRARIADGDTITLGRTRIQVANRLDTAALSGTAILSPKLSQPLLKTEIRKLRDLIDEVEQVGASLASGKAKGESLPALGRRLVDAAERLRGVEAHTRMLTTMNHFHELFHRSLTPKELYREAIRFIAAAIDAEDAALVIGRTDDPFEVEAAMGPRVVSWQTQIPPVFEQLLRRVQADGRAFHSPCMLEDSRLPDQRATLDSRAVLVAPITTPRGRGIGAAYFDNVRRPQALKARDTGLVEACLQILAGHIMGDESSSFPGQANGIELVLGSADAIEPDQTVF